MFIDPTYLPCFALIMLAAAVIGGSGANPANLTHQSFYVIDQPPQRASTEVDGHVISIEVIDRTITVAVKDKKEEYQVAEDVVVLKDDQHVEFTDLSEGDYVAMRLKSAGDKTVIRIHAISAKTETEAASI